MTSEEVYNQRVREVRSRMAKSGLSALVAGDNNSSWLMPSGHCRYLSNYSSVETGRTDLAVIPAEGDPVLIVPPGALGSTLERAKRKSWIKTVVASARPGWPPSRHADPLRDLESVLGRLASGASVGICGYVPQLEALKAHLPQIKFVRPVRTDARGNERDLLEDVRAPKTDYEEQLLRRAQICTNAGIEKYMEGIEAGAGQALVCATAEYQARKEGADDTLVVMSSGHQPWIWGQARDDLTFKQGDIVACEFNSRVDGYIAQIARSRVLGRPEPEQQQLIDVTIEAEEKMLGRTRIGVTGGELWDVAVAVVKEAGFEPWGRYGHGMGMSMAESLDILPGDDGKVGEGYSLELHAGVRNPKNGEGILIGDQVIMRNGTPKVLSSVPKTYGPK